MNPKNISKFIFEMGHLKRIRHEGWRLTGVDPPDSIAQHILRTAQISYILAKMEKLRSPESVCTMIVFHDIEETRIGDQHRVASRYLVADEQKAISDQLENLGELKDELLAKWKQFDERKTPEAIVAKDADRLEWAFTAKEYIEQGYKSAQDWINNVEKALKTDSAKRLLKELKNMDSTSWWHGLKEID